MTGPTREETASEATVRLCAIVRSIHHYGCPPDPRMQGRVDGDVQEAVEAAHALAEALRARHIREAVEGLPTAFTDGREFVRVCGHVMPRAALLAALTGEGK